MTPQKPSQLSRQLLRTAKQRISSPRDCTEADLRRATSDLYYAMFHRICEALVQPIGGHAGGAAFAEMFVALYRMPDHGPLEKRCKQMKPPDFTAPLRAFANKFVAMKVKRTDADYNPLQRFALSAVENDLRHVEELLDRFDAEDPTTQIRFAFFLTIGGRG